MVKSLFKFNKHQEKKSTTNSKVENNQIIRCFQNVVYMPADIGATSIPLDFYANKISIVDYFTNTMKGGNND